MRVSKTFVAERYSMESIKSAARAYAKIVKNARKLTAGTSHAQVVESNSYLVDFQTHLILKHLDSQMDAVHI